MIRNRRIPTEGYRRVMRMSEANARRIYNEKLSERESLVMKLKEKYSKSKGLAFGNGKLDEMFDKNPKKASNLLLFLENSEKQAMMNPLLLQNATQVQALNNLNGARLTEAMQTGGAMALMLPTDIVKIARIGYSNSISPDVFDVWGMTSMKDSLYKLETIYGSTQRGATEGDVIYENYGEGRYPSVMEKEDLTDGGSQTQYTKTLEAKPVIPFKVAIFVNNEQVAVDNGAGSIVGEKLSAGTINYTTGAVDITFSSALQSSDKVEIQYAYDFEASSLFDRTGSVLLNLVAYDFSAILYPLAVEWTRFSEDLMQSKLGTSAKDMLIAGAGDEFRKAFDETCIEKGIRASNWTTPIEFNCDFATVGSDSSYDHAQSVLNAIINAEALTYTKLGRMADTTNIVCDANSYSYLTKHAQFVPAVPSSRVGIFKVGSISGRDIYLAPNSIIKPEDNDGMMYLFGKSTQSQNVDAPVSVGSYGTGISTNPVELKNFNSQMGLGFYADIKTNNKFFATKVKLKNLTANS